MSIYLIYDVICGILGYEQLIWMILRMYMSGYYGLMEVIESVNSVVLLFTYMYVC